MIPLVPLDLRFRFRGVTGTSWSSDIAIDDIEIEAGLPVNVNQIAEETFDILVAPNPFRDYLEITTSIKGVLNYQIVSIDGKVVQDGQIQGTQSLPVQQLSTGVYFIRFSNDQQQVTHKIVKY